MKKVNYPKKKFGQNFLKDKSVIDKIINSLNCKEKQLSFEIGPGLGVLTKKLFDFSAQVIAIEIDHHLVEILEEKFKIENNFKIINQDILTFDFNTLSQSQEKWYLVGNLPYNISTQIILKILNSSCYFQKIVVMVQYEVAKRIIAYPSSKAYGRLSINVQRKADVFLQQIVPPECFNPVPAVSSAVLEITPKSISPNIKLDIALEKITKMAFNKRRKTIVNALKPLFTEEDLRNFQIDPKTRPEELSIGQYELLAKQII